MIRNGFKPYQGEWWHYTDTDTYGVEKDFNPSDNIPVHGGNL